LTLIDKTLMNFLINVLDVMQRPASNMEVTQHTSDTTALTWPGDHSPLTRHVDLCAGTGAFSHILQKHGLRTVYANDQCSASKVIWDLNHPQSPPLQEIDLCQVNVKDIPAHDVLTAGFPCQPFSSRGALAGFADPRSNVFWKISEIVRAHRPRLVILENVKNLKTHDAGKTFKTIQQAFLSQNYSFSYKVLDTAKYTGIPQHRERIYMICIDKTKYMSNLWAAADQILNLPPVVPLPLASFLESLTSLGSNDYYKTTGVRQERLASGMTQLDTAYRFAWGNQLRICNKGLVSTLLTIDIPLVRTLGGIRFLTAKEYFALQGFPSDYILPPQLGKSALRKLGGNAVTYTLASKIIDRCIKIYSH
jgi:DNA (cytosine-5)-methyltransferase 1